LTQQVQFTVGSNAPTTSLTLNSTTGAHGNIAPTAVQIGQFDTNNGTLKSIMVFEELTGKFRGTVGAATGSSAAGTHTIQIHVTENVQIASGMNANLLDGTGTVTLGKSPNQKVYKTVVTQLGLKEAGTATSLSTAAATPTLKPFQLPSTSSVDKVVQEHRQFTIGTPTSAYEHAGGGKTTLTIDTFANYVAPTGFKFGSHTATLTLNINGIYSYLPKTSTHTTTHATPEPASAFMLGAGVIALGAARRRQKRKTSPNGA
jgi:hypothetical protein